MSTEPTRLRFDDHGLQWTRVAGREIAAVDGHLLVVTEPPPGRSGFGFVVAADDAPTTPRTFGTAITRKEARRHAVLALAQLVGLPTLPDLTAGSTPSTPSTRLRAAAALVLLALFVVAVVVAVG